MGTSQKVKKFLAFLLTTVLTVGLLQFAPGVRTNVEAANVPEAGHSYTLNFTTLSGVTKLNGYTSDDGIFKVVSDTDKAYWHDGQHGAGLYNGDKIEVKVAGNADIQLGLCGYGNATAFTVTDEAGKEIGSTSGKGTQDGAGEKVSYSGDATTLTITCSANAEAYLHSVTVSNYAKEGKAENFTMMLDNIAKKGVVATGDYKYGDSVLTLVGQGSTQYTAKTGKTVKVNGKEYNSYTAGKRHASSDNMSTIPQAGDGTLTKFTPAAKGMMTVYFNSVSSLRVYDFNSEDGSKVGSTLTEKGVTSYSFAVAPGHTYVMSTTSATDNLFYAGYKYVVDKTVSVPVKFNNVNANLYDSFEIKAVDTELSNRSVKLVDGANVNLLEGHTYRLSTNDTSVKALVGDSYTFTATANTLVVSLYDVPDATVKGTITGTPAGTVKELTFENMFNGLKYTATITGNTYTCLLKPGEYKTQVETTNGGVTSDRVSVKAEGTTVNEVYVELPEKEAEAIPFKSEISVPGDYDSLNEASEAILHMQNRPEGEAGRVTINLTSDLSEQTVMNAPYVTLKGNGHTVSWYYGVGTLYYSVDPATGLYNEVLARDKYSYAEANANLWGGVFIVKGNNFIAEDTTFKNTYNYELTEAEKTDIAGSTLSVNRLAPNADVTKYAYKERSNAFYIDADNIECYNCKILSSQDTLGRNGSKNCNYHTYFNNCVIGGNVDYICGEFSAVFDNCELQWKTYKDDASNNAKVGYITAAKTSPYVFRNCNVTTDGVGTGVVGYYGRTWGASSNSTFIQTQTNGLINAEGWREMSAGDGQTAVFKEYGNLSGETPFVTNGKFCLAANQTAEAVADYIDTDANSAIKTVLNGWKPVHYGNAVKPGDKDDPTVTPKSGLMYENNHFVYYSDGEVNKEFKGLAEYEGEKYYVQNGTVDTKLTDVVYIDGTWYYIDKGRLNEETRDVIYHCGGWYFVENGTIDWTYTGVVEHCGGYFYVEKGQINWNYTGACKTDGVLYYIRKGSLDTNKNGLTYVDGTWFLLEKGKLKTDYTGLVQYEGRWYYVENGILNWNYTGLTKYYSTWYMVVNGQLDWKFNDVTYYFGTWYYVKNGVLDWNYTGLTQHCGTWYYVDHGRINWDYTGLTKYYGTWYMVVNGQLDWNFTNLTKYYNTWYYVENGKLNWNYTDLFQYFGTWYCIRGGVLDWNYTGLAYHAGGYYYIDHGVLDWNYSGYAQVNNKGTYYKVVNGKRV